MAKLAYLRDIIWIKRLNNGDEFIEINGKGKKGEKRELNFLKF